ncbi:ribosome small subunit-dependent GTPase A [Xylanimonas oleitrophica]|uniref:Small ribosomal subunit biogenesis GTPase RsgA n=1 Tax=Xylanimonas oleitrophica TaxID=2607479 RepID=A0A2W5YCX5_9MICO|nr:ribosome small subunit-dependent GTPase A [Xylanimonas oleitrophica]PZR52081.1 ribosome small subunit-dependent GTPase A [Xylanimonas oleitrophica]
MARRPAPAGGARGRGDEHEAWGRPSKRGSRPRTKQRPEHTDAVVGLVTGVDRGRYTLLLDEGGSDERPVLAMKARELTRTRVVVGDRVDVVGDTSGDPGTLARIVRIAERTSVLRRTADDTDPYERIVVANADQLVIVTALANPEPRTGMIDRAVVAAYDAGMDVLLCLTKADLGSPEDLRGLYEPLGVDVVVTRPADEAAGSGTLALAPQSVEEVRDRLRGRVSVLLGHSGVGKSTLVNALVPGAGRATGHVNDVTGRGRHTSTSAVALRLPARPGGDDGGDGAAYDGWVVDTPGVRSLGLAHVEVAHLLQAFEDLDEAAQECPRGCTHLADAPDCALDDWLAAAPDEAARATREARLDSFRRLLASRTASV